MDGCATPAQAVAGRTVTTQRNTSGTDRMKSSDVYTCFYCGFKRDDVEAGGIWYCPNMLCSGPGSGGFRSTLKSYKEDKTGHTVDERDWIGAAFIKLYELDDPELEQKVKESAMKMILGEDRQLDNEMLEGPTP